MPTTTRSASKRVAHSTRSKSSSTSASSSSKNTGGEKSSQSRGASPPSELSNKPSSSSKTSGPNNNRKRKKLVPVKEPRDQYKRAGLKGRSRLSNIISKFNFHFVDLFVYLSSYLTCKIAVDL